MAKTLRYETNLIEYGEVNSGFAKVKVSILTDQQVANNTKFNKESINKRLSGLNYLPIVGEFKKDDNDFGTHGGKLEISDDGFEFIDTTRPYGCIIADSYKWEDMKQKNGETIPYVTCQAYLWIDRYPELNCLYDGKLNNQSMEVKILDGKFNEDTWVYEINDFEFSALCILGKSISPAFVEAKVDVNFEKVDFKAEYQDMLFALDKYLNNKERSGQMENIEQVVEVEVFTDETTPVVDTNETIEIIEEEVTEEVVEEPTEDIEVVEVVEDEVVEEIEKVVEEEKVDYELLHNELQEKYGLLEQEVVALRQFKANKDKQDKLDKVNEFNSHLSDDELQKMYSLVDEKSIEELETMCFALLGKKKVNDKFSKQEVKHTNKVAIIDGTYGMNESWLDVLSKN